MFLDEIKNIDSSVKELRKFGVTMAIACAVISIFTLLQNKSFYRVFLAIAVLFAIFALLFPGALKFVHEFWMSLAHAMGWLMTRVILSVLFYLVLTPIGLIMRICGKDLLNTKFAGDNDLSYWISRKQQAPDRDYEKQF